MTLAFMLFLVMAVLPLQGCGITRKDFVGYVFSRETQKPVAGITVVAQDSGMWRPVADPVVTTTDERGRFVISIPTNSHVSLLVDAKSHVTEDPVTRINSGNGGVQWQGDQFPLEYWHLDSGGWLEPPWYSTMAVWLIPASREVPPDLSGMNSPTPPPPSHEEANVRTARMLGVSPDRSLTTTITRVERSAGTTRADLDVGTRDGVKPHWIMTVSDNGRVVAYLRITNLSVNRASGVIFLEQEPNGVRAGQKAIAPPDSGWLTADR